MAVPLNANQLLYIKLMPLSETVLVLMLLLAVGMLAAGLFRRLPIPYTVILVLIGVGLKSASETWLLFAPLSHFHLTPELVLFIFLPTLIFESGFNLNARALLKDIAPVLMLAVPALLASTAIVGVGAWLLLPIDLWTALVFGALISATDPVAVVALFKELGTPERLTVLVEGESLLNDATAIVLFNILLGIALYGGLDLATAGGAVLTFLKVFFGGALVGVVSGLIFSGVMSRLNAGTSATLILSLVLAYVSFVVAEHSLHLSGVMAVSAAALTMGIFAMPNLSHETGEALHETWEFLALICNTLLFLLVGFAADLVNIISRIDTILITVLLLLGARAAVVYVLLPMATRLFKVAHVTWGERHIMWWGGLKGGLAIAIVLSIPAELPGRQLLIDITLGIVLFTLLVNAPTIKPLIRWLGIDRLSDEERTELHRGLTVARHKGESVLSRFLEVGILCRSSYEQSSQILQGTLRSDDHQISDEQRYRQQRLNALRSESQELDAVYKAGMLTYYTYLELQGEIRRRREQIVDRNGSEDDSVTSRAGNSFLRLEDAFIRRIRELDWAAGLMSYYQKTRLSQQLIRDSIRILMAQRALDYIHSEPDLDPADRQQLKDTYTVRMNLFLNNVAKIRQEFPEFYQGFELRLSLRAALAAVAQEINEENRHGTIGAKSAASILRLVETVRNEMSDGEDQVSEPDAKSLLGAVPLFADLDDEIITSIAGRSRSVHFLQEDIVIGEGEHGDALYLIVRGRVAVSRVSADGEFQQLRELGAGDFFGELALLGEQVRTATVKAVQSCTLLRLTRKDVLEISAQHAAFKTRLDAARQARK
jgi:Na+:H+ antiporter